MSIMYGLIFDVDGVISDTESLSSRITAQVLARLVGIEGVTHQDFDAGRGRGAEAYLQAAAQAHGTTLTAEQLLEAEAARESAILAHLKKETLPAYPGVLALIAAARTDPEMKLAIATSSTRTKSRAVLTSAGVPYEGMAYVTGSDVANKKPAPELFLTAAAQINLPPANCLVIEDAPSGIEAAKRAGAACLAVTNSFGADKLQQADRVTGSLSLITLAEVREIIRLAASGSHP